MRLNDKRFEMVLNEGEVKTIVFDLGGVYFTQGSKLAIEKMVNFYQIKNQKLLREIFSDLPNREGYLLRRGLIDMDEFEKRFISNLNLKEENPSRIRQIWFSSYVPNYKMEYVLKKLKEKKLRLVVFSGNVKERVKFLDDRYHFLQYFDDHVFSYDFGTNKDEIKFYQELLLHLKCEPKEAILVEDELGVVNLANSVGLNVIQYCYTEQFLEELKKYNIQISIS